MEKIITDKFGCQIIKKGEKLFIRFDEGHINLKYANYEITEEEARRVVISEEEAYKVCLTAQKRNKKTCRWL